MTSLPSCDSELLLFSFGRIIEVVRLNSIIVVVRCMCLFSSLSVLFVLSDSDLALSPRYDVDWLSTIESDIGFVGGAEVNFHVSCDDASVECISDVVRVGK